MRELYIPAWCAKMETLWASNDSPLRLVGVHDAGIMEVVPKEKEYRAAQTKGVNDTSNAQWRDMPLVSKQRQSPFYNEFQCDRRLSPGCPIHDCSPIPVFCFLYSKILPVTKINAECLLQ